MAPPDITDRPVVVVSNPVAGNGRGQRYAHQIVDALEGGGAEISWEITQGDAAHRVDRLIDAIGRFSPAQTPIVIVCGGDGTAAEVCQAIYAVQTDEFRPTLVPGPGGTAGDMRRELGVPRSPAGMLRFFSSAVPVDLDVVMASNDGGPERLVLHSLGNGVSGAFFTEVEKMRQATGRTSIPTYLRALAGGVASAEIFYVRIDGGSPLPVGEVFTGVNATSMGAVTRIPLPMGGARVHAIPLDPDLFGVFQITPGLPPLLDAFWRGALYLLGDQRSIAPGERVGHLPPDHLRDVAAGESVMLEFFDAEGRPKPVLGIANGDTTGPASNVVIRHTGETISALAAADSAYRVRRGHVGPSTPMQRMSAGQSALPLSSFGGLMVYGDLCTAAAAGEDGGGGIPESGLFPFEGAIAHICPGFFSPAEAPSMVSVR